MLTFQIHYVSIFKLWNSNPIFLRSCQMFVHLFVFVLFCCSCAQLKSVLFQVLLWHILQPAPKLHVPLVVVSSFMLTVEKIGQDSWYFRLGWHAVRLVKWIIMISELGTKTAFQQKWFEKLSFSYTPTRVHTHLCMCGLHICM